MPEENTENAQAQPTADEQVNNTGAQAQDSGAVTDTAQANQAQQPKEKTFTQADIDRIVQDRLKKAAKSELKKLTGETDSAPNVNELQEQLKAYQTKARIFETKEAIRDYASDGRNKVAVRPENLRVIERLVTAEIEYDDDGNITNLKEAFDRVRSEAPMLFITATTQINAASGRNQPTTVDFNEQLRAQAGIRRIG